jgi:hypothetical protein
MTNASNDRGILEDVGRLADERGTMVTPVRHDELLHSIASMAQRMCSAGACSLAPLDENALALALVFTVPTGEGDIDPAHRGRPGNRRMGRRLRQPIVIDTTRAILGSRATSQSKSGTPALDPRDAGRVRAGDDRRSAR